MFAIMIFKEIRHRWLNSMMELVSVITATGCMVAAVSLLKSHDIQTDRIIVRKEAELKRRIDEYNDKYRKIMKRMGFNILILPKKQNLSEMYAKDFASEYMPEEYAQRLANSKDIVFIRHLLPCLQQKLFWPEKKMDIILIGIKGEIPLTHRTVKTPILQPVEPGKMVIGYALHSNLGISENDSVTLLGKKFTVAKCLPERSGKDDITIWIDLKQAQVLLNKEKRINGIWALECNCVGIDLADIRKKIATILPDTQVIEKYTKVLARAEVRAQAKEIGRKEIEAAKKNREEMREKNERFAAIFVPLIIIIAGAWIGLMAFGNVRDRRSEIGILRAIGVRSGQVMMIFLARAFILGLIGAVVGYAAGAAIIGHWSLAPFWSTRMVLISLIGAPVLACVASWIPALIAAGQDPADVLREE